MLAVCTKKRKLAYCKKRYFFLQQDGFHESNFCPQIDVYYEKS